LFSWQLFAGPDFVGGAIDGVNLAVVSPLKRMAVVLISRDMLRFPYHVRHELIEFAVYVLAARAPAGAPARRDDRSERPRVAPDG
jgi:hypothetical protein